MRLLVGLDASNCDAFANGIAVCGDFVVGVNLDDANMKRGHKKAIVPLSWSSGCRLQAETCQM